MFISFSGTAVAPIFSAILQTPYIQDIKTVKTFSWLLKLFPSFAVGSGFGNLFAISFANAFCESIDPKYLNFYCADNPKERDPVFKCCKGWFYFACYFHFYLSVNEICKGWQNIKVKNLDFFGLNKV